MFKSKSEKEKLMTKALKSIGMALTVSSILVGCAKELPEKEPDAIKDNTISVSETANAMIIVETVVVSPTEAGRGVIIPKKRTPVKPVVVPINPPIVDNISASKRN